MPAFRSRPASPRALGLLAMPALAALSGCMGDVSQVAGTGATYTTRCSADMLPEEGGAYKARCEPAACAEGFREVALNQVAVALDPGRKLVGLAERVCVQDLARASELFNPALQAEEAAKQAP